MPLTLQQATTDPRLCGRLLDTPGQVWVSLLWGHCSFILGSGAHKLLFVPSKSLFPQSCVIPGGSVVGLTATSSERLCHTQVCCTQSPCLGSSPLLTRTSSGNTQTHFVCSRAQRPTETETELFQHLLWRKRSAADYRRDKGSGCSRPGYGMSPLGGGHH